MKDQYQVVVIGGGIVGCSVLYHLTLRGTTDVALIEREELTAGSTWHAAGGFHAMNADTRIAALQKYTIGLYPQVEAESGLSAGLHMSGGMELAETPERWHWLRSELQWLRTQDTDAYLLTPEEAVEMVPILDPTGLFGALFDPLEGNLDPNGATQAYAGAARARGAEVIQHNRVLSLTPLPGGAWRVETEQGDVTAEHVVNAAGLWARRVGRMVGVDHPLVPMPHHYLVTTEIPQIAAIEGDMAAVTDLEGFTYLQKEGNGVLLGVYEERPVHWAVDGARWDYDGLALLPPDIDRIAPELELAYRRFPVLGDVLYGGSPASRLMLHAERLAFRHPATGERVSFESPPDFGAEPRAALRAAFIDRAATSAWRVAHGAPDGWPGARVDRLGDYLLFQAERDCTLGRWCRVGDAGALTTITARRVTLAAGCRVHGRVSTRAGGTTGVRRPAERPGGARRRPDPGPTRA
jgi:glycine/D-amino acid oxidase-like deaminating enzyme